MQCCELNSEMGGIVLTVSLQKGQKVDLTKGSSLAKILVGLGWDAEPTRGGLFGTKKIEIDCDASVIMLNENNKFTSKDNLIYFGNLKSKNASIQHMGDNRTGEGEGDDEQIMVDLKNIPADIHRLIFVVNIYDCKNRKQDFGMVKNAFIRIVDNANNKEFIRYNLSNEYGGKTAVIVAEVYRHQGEWKFSATGEGTNDLGLSDMLKRYA
jgi:stress response protein SCP2